MDFPALGFVDEAKEIMPEDLDDALLDEDSEGSFDDGALEGAKVDDKDEVKPAKTPTKKAANPKATKAKAKPRASAAKAKPRASARKAAAPKKAAAVTPKVAAKKKAAGKKAVAARVDTKVAKPPAAKKKAAKKAPGLLIADFNIAPRLFATTSSMRARA